MCHPITVPSLWRGQVLIAGFMQPIPRIHGACRAAERWTITQDQLPGQPVAEGSAFARQGSLHARAHCNAGVVPGMMQTLSVHNQSTRMKAVPGMDSQKTWFW